MILSHKKSHKGKNVQNALKWGPVLVVIKMKINLGEDNLKNEEDPKNEDTQK